MNKRQILPTIKLVTNILKIIKKQSVVKTEMVELTKNNHTSITNHIRWLERKKMIKSVIKGNKIKFEITDFGKDFLKILS